MNATTQGLGSEFGIVLAELVAAVFGAIGAALIDGEGNTVDFAHDPAAIDDLDLQIAGAQVALALAATTATATRFGIAAPSVLLEATRGHVMAASLAWDEGMALVLVMQPRANLGGAWRRFAVARRELDALLRA
jgi:predicted regulator of Ras-like GTPase activity (Roadblock/LC7/MglB family)